MNMILFAIYFKYIQYNQALLDGWLTYEKYRENI